MDDKNAWTGRMIAVQPRITLTRSFDGRSHSYQGYVPRLAGTLGTEDREFQVAIGKGAHAKRQFFVGDAVSGVGEPVADRKLETSELYKVRNPL